MLRHDILGMRLDYIAAADFVATIVERARERQRGYCCIPDVYQCVMTYDDAHHREIVNNADFVVSDSTVLQRARSLRHRVPMLPAIRGAELMIALCHEAAVRSVPVALLGGRTEEALQVLVANLEAACSGLNISFAHSPPFRPLTVEEDQRLVEDLNRSGASLLLLGLGCPKQERFMASHRDAIHAIMVGVGAAFDFNGGVVRASPTWVHRAGFDWLYRFAKEPTRLWRRYLLKAPRFVLLIGSETVRQRVLGEG